MATNRFPFSTRRESYSSPVISFWKTSAAPERETTSTPSRSWRSFIAKIICGRAPGGLAEAPASAREPHCYVPSGRDHAAWRGDLLASHAATYNIELEARLLGSLKCGTDRHSD